MRKAEIRIINSQQEESPIDVNGYEAASLLAKYGYGNQPQQPIPQVNNNPNSNLTFEEMIKQQEIELESKRMREQQKMNQPHSYTFNSNNVNFSETKYSSLEGEDIGIRVQIVSDMPIKKYYE